MNKTKQILFHILALCILDNAVYFTISWISPPMPMTAEASLPGEACTAFCLNNGDHCVFGPFEFLAYLLSRRKKRRTAKVP